MRKLSVVVLTLLLILLGILAFNSLTLANRQIHPPALALAPAADYSGVLAQAVTDRTVSLAAGGSPQTFDQLLQHLRQAFPRAHTRLDVTPVARYSRLMRWSGSNPRATAGLFAAHLDVVPATDAAWQLPPFAGTQQDGFVWGRGSMDDKAGVVALLAAVEELLQENFHPARTLYFAFGHDEETGGSDGAKAMASIVADREKSLAFVIDEGGPIVSGVVPGMSGPVALIGIAEKGYADIRLRTAHTGGHASMPPGNTAIARLARALTQLDASPLPPQLNPATRAMFSYLAPEMDWGRRTVFANLWLTEPLVLRMMSKQASANAAVRTTAVATLISGGTKSNVLPSSAQATINVRMLPGTSQQDVMLRLAQTIGDPQVEILADDEAQAPSAVSGTDNEFFASLQRTVGEVYPQAAAAPYMLVAITDSRHYAGLTRNIYRFRPQHLAAADLDRIHGVDERISVEDLARMVAFYKRYIVSIASP